MKRYFILALLLVASGCASTGPYADFAKAGRTYAAALDAVLDKATDVRVDATSEDLLHVANVGRVPDELYERRTLHDVESVAEMNKLRDHAKLLATYFDALEALAESTAPEDAAASAGKAFDALQAAGKTLPGRGGATSATKFAVSGIQNAKLRRELEKNGDALRAELTAEHDLIARIRRSTGDAARGLILEQSQRLKEAVTNGKTPSDPDAWAASRRSLLRRPVQLEELDAASAALDDLQNAYDELLRGQLAPVTMRSIAHNIEVKLKGGAS
jgi:hypothetical protein